MATDDLPEAIEEVPPEWRPSTQLDVERALRGLERIAARYAEVQRMATEWRADIDEWEKRHRATLSRQATALNIGLEHWATEQRAISGGRVKSFDFPSGRIETLKARSKTVIDDEAVLREWLEENLPEALKKEVTVLVSVIAKSCEVTDKGKFVAPDGEIVPGVHQQVLPDSAVSAVVKLASQRALPKASA